MSTIMLSRNIGREVALSVKKNSHALADSIKRLASGLRVERPQDGIYEYMRGKSLESSVRQYEEIGRNLAENNSILKLANDAANEILDNLNSMLEYSRQASDPLMSSSDRSALYIEFDSARTAIDSIVKGTKYENGGILFAAGQYNQPISIAITPDRSVSMDIDLNPLDVTAGAGSGLVIDNAVWGDENDAVASATEIETAIDTLKTFMSQVSGYLNQIKGHANITDSVIENYNAAKSALVGVDVADEMATYTALDVAKEAGIAMLAQANISYRSLLKLYEFDN